MFYDINLLQRFDLDFSKNVTRFPRDPQIMEDLLDHADILKQRGVLVFYLNELAHHWRKKGNFKEFENMIKIGQYMFNDNEK